MIIPAIDLIGGKVVRLFQGDYARKTEYTASPQDRFDLYVSEGAKYLHLVDLDGAKDPAKRQLDTISSLIKNTPVPVEIGGGIRSRQDAEALLNIGADRVVIGSCAVKNPAEVKEWFRDFGAEHIVLALDINIDPESKKRFIAVKGWQENSGVTIEELIKDPKVKGMWNVPKYSNPAGIIYSEETVRRIASMKPAAEDFLLMWDNAYCVHEFDGDYVEMPDILSLCEKYGNADMVFEFASTSKVTFPGAGISCFACSEANMAYMKKLLGVQMISADKMNQLRHVLFLKDKENTIAHMKKHAVIMKPKFDMVCDMLDREIAPEGIATWTRPKGGYFVCVRTKPGLAKRTVELCKEAGVAVTPAGATHPYGIDPDDSVIRIAPSFPPIDELEKAMEVFCVCLKLAAAEKNV